MGIKRFDVALAEQKIDVGNCTDISSGDMGRRAANQQPVIVKNCRRLGDEFQRRRKRRIIFCRRGYWLTSTPFQKAMWSLICAAFSSVSG